MYNTRSAKQQLPIVKTVGGDIRPSGLHFRQHRPPFTPFQIPDFSFGKPGKNLSCHLLPFEKFIYNMTLVNKNVVFSYQNPILTSFFRTTE